MKKLFKFFKDNGLYETTKRIFKKLLNYLGILQSETFMLSLEESSYEHNISELPKYKIERLEGQYLKSFNAMKYYDFLDANKLINSNQSNAIIALDDDKIIGFVCCHRNVKHNIHELGYWNLCVNEAWIGPTYVIKEYRNRKVHKLMLFETIRMMRSLGVVKFYTAINKYNKASLKSFYNIGFRKIGMIKIRKLLGFKVKTDILSLNNNFENMKKYTLE